MRTVAYTLTASFVLAGSLGVLASDTTIQPSYDALMAMTASQRQATLRALEEPARLELFRTHIDRWLEQHRGRLSASQVSLVTDLRNTLTTDSRDDERSIALQVRMRCELWRSDVIELSLPHRDTMSSSRLNDIGNWLRECVVAKAIDLVF
jgi:hypothetical protein